MSITPQWSSVIAEDWLPPNSLEQRQKAIDLQIAVKLAQDQLYEMTKTCKHVVLPLTPESQAAFVRGEWLGMGRLDSAICEICDSDLGWRCPDSPDLACHYYSENGFVKLINGEQVPIPEDHNPKYENSDSCIFCHSPDERK